MITSTNASGAAVSELESRLKILVSAVQFRPQPPNIEGGFPRTYRQPVTTRRAANRRPRRPDWLRFLAGTRFVRGGVQFRVFACFAGSVALMLMQRARRDAGFQRVIIYRADNDNVPRAYRILDEQVTGDEALLQLEYRYADGSTPTGPRRYVRIGDEWRQALAFDLPAQDKLSAGLQAEGDDRPAQSAGRK